MRLPLRRAAPESVEVGELNFTPYLDILMNLIIFMLLSVTGLATHGMIRAEAAGGATPGEAPLTVSLTVLITPAGYVVEERRAPAGNSVEAEPLTRVDIARQADGALDTEALVHRLDAVQDEWAPLVRSGLVPAAATRRLVLRPVGDVPLEALVATMDAARRSPAHATLFPDVSLGW